MPAADVTELTKSILWQAYTLESATAGTGLPFLLDINAKLVAPLQNAGLKMVSASTASKSYSFAEGVTTASLAAAVNDALSIFNNMTTVQLGTYLNNRRVACTVATFGGCYR